MTKLLRVLFLGISSIILLFVLSACGLSIHSAKFKQNLIALSVTSLNPLHQKHVPKLKKYKITNKKDVQTLYSILENSRKASKGLLHCPMDTGVYYKMRFQSKHNHANVTVKPTGCSFIKGLGAKKILWGKSKEEFWNLLAKDLHVNVNNMYGIKHS